MRKRPRVIIAAPPPIRSVHSLLLAGLLATSCGEPPAATTVPTLPVGSVTISPPSATILEDETVPLTVAVFDPAGGPLEGRRVVWQSSNPTIAEVSEDGVVRGIRLGTVRITAASEEQIDSASVTVLLLFRSVSAGIEHSCGITLSRAAYCWGAGRKGRLGTGATESTTKPSLVQGKLEFLQIAAGFEFTCGLTISHEAYCWGGNRFSQLGSGGKKDSWVPAPVAGGLRFQSVTSHSLHGCGLEMIENLEGAMQETTNAYCWGGNWYGEVGTGSRKGAFAPAPVVGGLLLQSMGAGGSFTCGVAEAGTAHCWGDNRSGQLGAASVSGRCMTPFGEEVPCSTVPVPVIGGPAFESVVSGWQHACALTAGGAVHCWGDNSFGQLGNGSTTPSSTPVPVSGGLSFVLLTAGYGHTCGFTRGGIAYCWGDNASGALGTSATFESCGGHLCSTTPAQVAGGHVFQSLSAGGGAAGGHSCGVTTGGQAWCWGRNASGQLGVGIAAGTFSEPVLVEGQPGS